MRVPIQDLSGLSLGIEFFASIVVMVAAGHWADGRFGTSPWLTILGFVLGAAAGFRSMYRFATKTSATPPGVTVTPVSPVASKRAPDALKTTHDED